MKCKLVPCVNVLCGKKLKSTEVRPSGCCSLECEKEMQERLDRRKENAQKLDKFQNKGDMDFHWITDGW